MMGSKRPSAHFVLVLLWGCAAPQMSAPPVEAPSPQPSSPEEAREEIDRLERCIDEDRHALGLPTHRAPDAADKGAIDASSPAPPEARESAPSPVEQAREPEARSVSPCTRRCRHVRAICRAARHICDLARYLDEEDARRRCRRAEKDCAEARAAEQAHCDGCRD